MVTDTDSCAFSLSISKKCRRGESNGRNNNIMRCDLNLVVGCMLLGASFAPAVADDATGQDPVCVLKDGLVYELQTDEDGNFDGTAHVVSWVDSITELNIPGEVELVLPETSDDESAARVKAVQRSVIPGDGSSYTITVTVWFTKPKPIHSIIGQISPGLILSSGGRSLSHVYVDSKVRTVGRFMGYKNLKQVLLSAGQRDIVDSMFMDCSNLEAVACPTMIRSIGNHAFAGCTSLKTVSLDDGTSVGNHAFAGCTALSKVDLPWGCHIHSGAFDSCINLCRVDFAPDCYVYGNPFTNCTNLAEVVVKDNYNPRLEVRDGCLLLDRHENRLVSAFPSTISRVTIPVDVREIGETAFAYCSNLKTIVLPYTVEQIGYNAFMACGLERLDTDQLTDFGDNSAYNYQFQDCQNLKKVYIGKNMKAVSARAFYGCNNLTEFVVDPQNDTFYAEGGALYDKYGSLGSRLRCCPPGFEAFTVPDGIVSVGEAAFCGSGRLANVVLPQSLENIGDDAFQNCTALTDVTIPDNVRGVWHGTFCGCSNLETLTIGKGMSYMRGWAFDGCGKLTTLNVLAEEPPYALYREDEENDIFPEMMLRNTTVYVPEASLGKYKESSLWSRFDSLKGMSGIANIDGGHGEKIYTIGNSIVIEGVSDGSIAKVYEADGRLVYSGTNRLISVDAGIYIVIVNGAAQKVMVR